MFNLENLNTKQIVIIFISILIVIMLYYKFSRNSTTNTDVKNIQNFSNKDNVPKIINFNTSWCYWSKKVQPVWEELTTSMKGKDIEVLDVKCDLDENRELCERYQVEGFPTIKLVIGNSILDYEGDRSLDDLKKFIHENVKY